MSEIFSPYLITIVTGWLVAQGLKYLITAIKHRNLSSFRALYLSGNMPSAHSTTVVALAMVIGLNEGLDSAVFGLATLLAGVVMYDAMMVRRSSGEQGLAIRAIISDLKSKVVLPRAAKGHTPFEVGAGALLGCVIGLVVFFATK